MSAPGSTDVFADVAGTAAGIVLLARRSPDWRRMQGRERAEVIDTLRQRLSEMTVEGWTLSVRNMFTDGDDDHAVVYDTSFAHSHDMAALFDAPSLNAALAGIDRLEAAGWGRVFETTTWMTGPREFAPVPGAARTGHPRTWGFVALWDWNDAWHEANASERAAYDQECDEAFGADIAADIDIAGRYDLAWASDWDHAGVWEFDDIKVLRTAMCDHERVGDFKFTTSRHLVGQRVPLLDLIGDTHG
jgi:hypothetical protein